MYAHGLWVHRGDSLMFFDRCDVIIGGIRECGISSLNVMDLLIEPTVTGQSFDMHFIMPEATSTMVTIYNCAGLRHKEVFGGILQKGPHAMTIATSDLPAGAYFLTLRTQERIETVKFIIAR